MPNWWDTISMPVVGFLRRTDWTGKTVIQFVTSGGSRFGRTSERLREPCPGADIASGLAVQGHEVERSRETTVGWAMDEVRRVGPFRNGMPAVRFHDDGISRFLSFQHARRDPCEDASSRCDYSAVETHTGDVWAPRIASEPMTLTRLCSEILPFDRRKSFQLM